MKAIERTPMMRKVLVLAACLALAAGLACAWAASAYATDTDKPADSDSWTITFKGNDGTIAKSSDSKEMDPQVVKKGDTVKLSANKYTREGYTFKEWNAKKDGKGKSYKDKAEVKPTEDMTLYAQWEAEKLSITFDANGGTGTMSKQEATYKQDVTLEGNSFTREGYSFTGWNTKKDGDGKAYDNKGKYSFTENTTLYAQWKADAAEPKAETADTGKGGMTTQDTTEGDAGDRGMTTQEGDVTVTFHSNYEPDATTTQTLTNGAGALDANTFTRSGYSFTNWATETGGGGKTYSDGETVAFDTNTVLYAQWIENVTVTFNANGGSGTMNAQSIPKSISTALNENAFTYTGHSFNSWNTKSDGSGTTYSNKGSVTLEENTTLYAQWDLDKLTISYNSNGGSGSMASQEVSYNVGATLNKNTFTRDGYTFTGWKDENGKSYNEGGTYAFTANTTLYAQWDENAITVTFKANGGSGTMKSQTMAVDEKTKLNANKFTRSGYTFDGWNTKKDGSGKTYSNKATVSFDSDTTLYAQWEESTITVSFKANGGTGTMANQEMTSGVSTALKANTFTRTGYTFNGWNTKSDGKGTSYANKASVKLSSDTTLYAQWKKTSSSNTTSKSGSSTPKTGDQLTALPIIVIAVIAGGVALFAVSRSRKRSSSAEGDTPQQ